MNETVSLVVMFLGFCVCIYYMHKNEIVDRRRKRYCNLKRLRLKTRCAEAINFNHMKRNNQIINEILNRLEN